MREKILEMVMKIGTDWGLRKAYCYIKVLLEEEAKKESPGGLENQ